MKRGILMVWCGEGYSVYFEEEVVEANLPKAHKAN